MIRPTGRQVRPRVLSRLSSPALEESLQHASIEIDSRPDATLEMIIAAIDSWLKAKEDLKAVEEDCTSASMQMLLP